jgi:hypothetical protein
MRAAVEGPADEPAIVNVHVRQPVDDVVRRVRRLAPEQFVENAH